MLLTGIYFNLQISLLAGGGALLFPALHKRMVGIAKSRAWLKVSADRICVSGEPRSLDIHTYSTVQETGSLQPNGEIQIAGQAPSTGRTLTLPSSQGGN